MGLEMKCLNLMMSTTRDSNTAVQRTAGSILFRMKLMMSTTRNSVTAVRRIAIPLEWQAFGFVYPVYARIIALETGVELLNVNKFFLWN